jgi:aspartate aminotransferase-like enzyme
MKPASPVSSLTFKIASEPWEFEAVHHLNYKTFVEEIPQHERNPEQRLVDKFHAENTYAICLYGKELVGMVAGRTKRPFSLDSKLPNLDSHLPAGRRVLEVRLLSVEKSYRNGFVFSRLVGLLAQHFREQGFDLAIISGTVRQLKLYKHLGFQTFGPLVGTAEAAFQPMFLTLETFLKMAELLTPPSAEVNKILSSFLPGPVDVHEEVRKAFEKGPISHRSEMFMADFQATKRLLCELTKAKSVEIMVGSGSLSNDAVCAQISLLRQPGLILNNGEFGSRLVDHANRQKLQYEECRVSWGETFDYDEIRKRLEANPKLGWVWAVHCETSTGILNHIEKLQAICDECKVKLCLDCISSIGTVPVDLSRVYLASCVSGKALASFPGLSMVFYNHAISPAAKDLPRYLDLGYYAAQSGIPFTHSSNLVYALQTALHRTCWEDKYKHLTEVSVWLRARLKEVRFDILAPAEHSSPAVFSLVLPADVPSKTVGFALQKAGYLLSYNSEYLVKRNWVQICLMGEWAHEHLTALPDVIAQLCTQHRRRPAAVQPQPAASAHI